MSKRNRKLTRWLIPTLIPALCGCAIKNAYPTYPVPERPEIRFEDTGQYCMSDAELRLLNEYAIKMEALAHKYECEITLINGGVC